MRRVFLFILLIFPLLTFAQATFEVNAPTIVALGEPFRVEFTANDEVKDFQAPAFDGFNVIAGPSTSQSKNVSYINGKLTQFAQYTYTYVVVAESAGNTSIGAATANVGGKSMSTKVLPLEVVKEKSGSGGAANSGSNSGAGASNGRSQSSQSSSTIASDDLILRVVPSRTNVYVGEPILVELKLYSRARVVGLNSANLAAFNGFWNQELQTEEKPMERETYKDKVYDTMVLKEFLLFPQKSGTLQIEQMSINAVVAVMVNMPSTGSIFDSFFGGGQQVNNINKKLTSSAVNINVMALPVGAPASFDGAVGQFSITGKINEEKISANSSNALVLTVSGKGNFPLMATPKVNLPTSFELYPSKSSDNYRTTSQNISGSRIFDYPFIARAEGNFDIDGVEFSYFDPAAKQYKTIKTSDFNLSVLKDVTGRSASSGGGIINSVTKEDLRILGEDIRFIKVGDPNLRKRDDFIVWSWRYILSLFVMCALFVAAIVYMKKRIKELRDTVKLRNKKANKVALNRLKSARKFKNDNMENEFYSEMLRALTGYVGDKLNIEVSRLSKDNMSSSLQERGVAQEDIDLLLTTISNCEFAQYAPMSTVKMSDVYECTLQLIGRLESKL